MARSMDRNFRKLVHRWHRAWRRDQGDIGNRVNKQHVANNHRQRRAGNYGTHRLCAAWVRDELYDWFIGMRYSIDWKKLIAIRRSRGERKALGRFPRSMLVCKVQELQHAYAEQCLLNGTRPTLFKLRTRWLTEWQAEYGLSLLQPNRRWKCPRAVLDVRCEAFWITVFRVRALCIECNNYDPEFENFDQTPYHHNEGGSKGGKTLAVKGSIVPLVEGHDATRKRWSANLTTFSNKERIRNELPYAEFLFKHDDKTGAMELRLREHIRTRGWGKWVTVGTSPSGSYSEHDIINFLDRHLTEFNTQWRGWRIMLCDDFGAHKSHNVRRLCWERGYVLIVLPGGSTPVLQTPDTDLNQHVRRNYIAQETVLLIERFRYGQGVPTLNPENMMDIMVGVLSNPSLHLHAADGYLKTAVAVDIDGKQDIEITREAGDTWRRLGMRDKINHEIACIRREARSGRLQWTFTDVFSLTMPYPACREVDAIVERTHDDNWTEELENECADAAIDEEEGDADDIPRSSGDEGQETGNSTDGESSEAEFVVATSQQLDPPDIAPAEAELIQETNERQGVLHQMSSELASHGLMHAASTLRQEIAKDMRRQRAAARESPAVADALMQWTIKDAELQRQKRRQLRALNDQKKTAKHLRELITKQQSDLKRKKLETLRFESLMETKHELKTFTPEYLGLGLVNAGGAKCRDHRYEVMNRMARLGAGLTAAQRNDWDWFKQAWDSHHVGLYGDAWGNVFAGYMQVVLNDLKDPEKANAFSVFVYTETRRVFSDVPAISL